MSPPIVSTGVIANVSVAAGTAPPEIPIALPFSSSQSATVQVPDAAV